MKTGDIKRIGRRTYCVIGWTDTLVHLQSMDERRLLITMPRTKFGGMKNGG
jgi:hypothetical protein